MDKDINLIFSGNEKCNICGGSSFDSQNLRLKCLDCGKEYPDFNYTTEIDSNNLVFGYGSLILPTSAISRFTDFDIETEEIYSKDPDRSHVRAEGILNLNKFDLSFIPVKLRGFKRSYSIESRRGGKMLNCIYTGNKSDFVNGTIIKGLTESQLDEISSTEKGYSLKEINKENISFYSKAPSGEFKVNIYVADENKLEDGFEDRNEIYHNRIIAGINFLKLKYDNKLAKNFYRDFINSF